MLCNSAIAGNPDRVGSAGASQLLINPWARSSGLGGANIAWNLWITKLAPKGKEGNYMSVHMTLTGVRGVTAPFLGYLLESQVGFQGVSYLSVGMIFLATVLFATTIKSPRFLSKNNFEELQS